MTEPIVDNNFIKNIIADDLAAKRHSTIITRFPPEPNGYLHIGHAKSICLNFGLARDFNGSCNLRFDDTNPAKESTEYVNSICSDIAWLGFQWHGEVRYASDYFSHLYDFAVYFIKQGLAYVCELTPEQTKDYRGDFNKVGTASPWRERSIEDNLELFEQMRLGSFADGSKTLRLKIDMAAANLNLRDPVIYRIKRAHHIRTEDKWCIYPMYDYTHAISDALEHITHSCCTLEFEDHRPLYNWVVEHLIKGGLLSSYPRQIEFARLELQSTITSKRKLNMLVVDKLVSGWDDPRLPTISGMRRRGYTPDGIKLFIKRCGVSKSANTVEFSLLENSIREDLETHTPKVMAVVAPLKVTITNFAEINSLGKQAQLHPQLASLGSRLLELTPVIYIEQEDFCEIAPKGWKRLITGGEVRLRHSYVLRCDEVIKDDNDNIIELLASVDLATLGKNPEGRKVAGVIHWVNANAKSATIRLYDRLFNVDYPDKVDGVDFKELLNPNSCVTTKVLIEPNICDQLVPESRWQFERVGYFVVDRYDSSSDNLVFNRIVALRDNWSKTK